MWEKQYESRSAADHCIDSSGRNRFLLSDWHFFLPFSPPLLHTKVLHWPALNPISNKTRCPARSHWCQAAISQECALFGSSPIDQSFRGFYLVLPRLDGSLIHSLPHALMTLPALHAANELMDQHIDPAAAVYEWPITLSKQCRNWLWAQPGEQSTIVFREEM